MVNQILGRIHVKLELYHFTLYALPTNTFLKYVCFVYIVTEKVVKLSLIWDYQDTRIDSF